MEDLQQAIEIASGYTNDSVLKQRTLDFIQQFKASPDSWRHCLTILSSEGSVTPNLKFFIFQVFDEKIPSLTDQEILTLKDAILSYLKNLIDKNQLEPVFLRNAVAKTLGLIFVHTTLSSSYQTMIEDLLSLATKDGQTFNEIATDYYLKTLVIIHQEIGDQMITRDKEEADRNNRLKDFIRDHEMVRMAGSWREILRRYVGDNKSNGDANTTSSTSTAGIVSASPAAADIIDTTLLSIGLYSSWIEINLILDQTFLTIFYQCLTSNNQKIQIRTAGMFIDILHKKMPPPKKLELIDFLHLIDFINQFNVKDLDFSFAQALAQLSEQLGSECIDLMERSTHDELKYDEFRNLAVSKVLEVIPLILQFLEHEYDDISLEVFPFLSNYFLFLKKNIVNEDLDFSALNNDQMLTTLLKKIILKMRYDEEDDGDDEESIELFNEVRSKLTSFQDSIVIINDMLSLEVMIESINEFLFQHLNGQDGKSANWRDIELGLYQLTYYSEMLRNNVMNLPKTMLNASRPYYVFNEMLCKVVDNSTDILVSHPLIQLLFFELIMKHYTFFTNSNIQVDGVDKTQILLKVLKIFVSNFGIFSENPKVKYRSWYLFYRFIRLTRPQVDDFVIVELVESLTPLLEFSFGVKEAGNTNLRDIDLTLVEETGSFENQLYLLEAIGILITLMGDSDQRIAILQGVLQPFFSNLEKCINSIENNLDIATLLQAHHSLVSIGTIVKGFESFHLDQYNDKFIEILQQISQVVLITLERFDDFNVVREACSFCMVRLFILLSKLDSDHGGAVVQDVLSKFITITMNGFDKRKMPEIVNFLNFVTQLFHYCTSVEQVYLLLSSLLAPLIGKVMSRIELESSNAADDFTKRDILDLQKSLISLLASVSNDNLNSLWLMSDDNKQILATVINLMLSYSYNYSGNDISLVRAAISELNVLNRGLGAGKVFDSEDKFKNDGNIFEKSEELLIGNSIMICIELTFKLQNKELLLKDAQFRNGVLLEVSRLLKTIAYVGNEVPDTNTLMKEKKNGNATTTNISANDVTCQQISNALTGQLGYPADAANEFIRQLIRSTDRQFTKYLIGLIE
ncbi:DEKNAAC104068 [Brettanomyces naardenensis]|uniref:Exportin-T n=1 Tax=Brettanomyces naardenensis TaxID=13370 RepID=A0A448YQ21_BRENA|nr:DEKNAAC104068 [Brettanomyces naardenensis]